MYFTTNHYGDNIYLTNHFYHLPNNEHWMFSIKFEFWRLFFISQILKKYI